MTTEPKTTPKPKIIIPDEGGGIAMRDTQAEEDAQDPKLALRDQRCETCECGYFNPKNPMGTCRREPPTVFHVPIMNPKIGQLGEPPFFSVIRTVFPEMQRESWCIDGYRPLKKDQH